MSKLPHILFCKKSKIYFHLIFLLQTACCERKLIVPTTHNQHSEQPKIIGGEATTIDQVPYLINLRRNGNFICGGSLVTPKCVLTAAHCTHGLSPSELTVYGGSSKLSEISEMREVERNLVPLFYNPVNLDMDVAILKLSRPLSGSNIATISICGKQPNDNEFVKISGWGVTSEGNNYPPDQVRTANVPIISRTQCLMAYAGKAILTHSMFCAAVPGQKDSCSGDSGGPVVYNGCVYGIVSWGFGCASATFPGVYTNLKSVRVQSFVRQSISRYCQ